MQWLARCGLAQRRCMFDTDFCHRAEGGTEGRRGHRALWAGAAVVVGMHPDEATEPVVAEALRAGKPFAVVPCCVFPKLFPERRTAGGKLVTTHAEFVAYLCTLHPGIRTDEIEGLPGCNTVVYWMAGEEETLGAADAGTGTDTFEKRSDLLPDLTDNGRT